MRFKQFCEEQGSKLLILMRGVSGSGKSTLAKELAKQLGGVVYSTDQFFEDETGNYQFDVKKIGINHQKNQQRTEQAMQQGISPIIIDNTNTQAWEMQPYVLLADKYGYEIKIREPGDSEEFRKVDLQELMDRQKQRADQNKSLPEDVVRRMLDRFQAGITPDDIRKAKKPF